MKFVEIKYLIKHDPFGSSAEWKKIYKEIRAAIAAIVWPTGARTFTIYPEKGKKRGEGNGVKPIKMAFIEKLSADFGWAAEEPLDIATRRKPGNLDGVRKTKSGLFAVEWETGNVSSSHRALNKMLLGMLKGVLIGGVLVVPTRKLYVYLTDRVGNFEELSPYFDFWAAYPVKGVLAVIAVEHDAESFKVPRIEKGTDGRALL